MPCDTRLKPRQTIQQRAAEVREVVARAARGLVNGTVKVRVGPQGAVAFAGLEGAERDGVTDACLYRRLLASAAPSALQAIARAEMLAGRSIDQRVVAVGAHSHDGGRTWHDHKG